MDARRLGSLGAVAIVLLAGSATRVAAETTRTEQRATTLDASTSQFSPGFRYTLPGAMWQSQSYEEERVVAIAEGVSDPEDTISNPVAVAASEAGGPGPMRGMVVVNVTDALTHPCPMSGRSRVPLGDEPSAFLADLQTISGLRLEDMTALTVDGWPAVSATSVTLRCGSNDLHLSTGLGRYVTLQLPSRLIVTRVGSATVLIQIWAGTILDLEGWLPVAQQFVDSLDFDEDGDPASSG